MYDCVYGQHDAHWLGFYNYFDEVLQIEEAKKLVPLQTIAKHCCWWFPTKDFAIVSRKPAKCSVNDDGGIHCLDGAAIAFADGFKIFAINGVVVSEKVVISPEELTTEEIREEENIEVKRIMIERYGWDKFLQEVEAKVIDSKSLSPEFGHDWLEALYYSPRDGITAIATYDPSTGRPYFLEVPDTCKTCESAQRYLLSSQEILQGTGFDFELDTYPKLRT